MIYMERFKITFVFSQISVIDKAIFSLKIYLKVTGMEHWNRCAKCTVELVYSQGPSSNRANK